MLAIQKHIIEHGLEATVEKFKLDTKDYPHKILLKYNQIESPMREPESQDARGLVLRKSDWSVLSLAFRKFFNLEEGNCAPIDWSTAKFYEKMDGTLIHVYSDGKSICFGTTGTAEGEGPVDNFHWSPDGATEKSDGTFADLFWKAFLDTNEAYWSEHPEDKPILLKGHYTTREQAFAWWSGYTLAFELCTPHNIVVTPHEDFRVYLLGARDLRTLQEESHDTLVKIARSLGVPMAKTYDISNQLELKRFVSEQPFKMEGVVVCDANFNRCKVKNPAYVTVHFMREASAFWRIVDVVRGGEIDEYLAYFPGRSEEVNSINEKWTALNDAMEKMSEDVAPYVVKVRSLHPEDAESRVVRKEAASYIASETSKRGIAPFRSFFFSMLGGTRGDVHPEMPVLADYLREFDGKELYSILSKQ